MNYYKTRSFPWQACNDESNDESNKKHSNKITCIGRSESQDLHGAQTYATLILRYLNDLLVYMRGIRRVISNTVESARVTLKRRGSTSAIGRDERVRRVVGVKYESFALLAELVCLEIDEMWWCDMPLLMRGPSCLNLAVYSPCALRVEFPDLASWAIAWQLGAKFLESSW